MPRQDAQGRWISDDGLSYWDGAAWRPLGSQPAPTSGYPQPPPPAAYAQPAAAAGYTPPAAQGRSRWGGVLIGCGIALVVVIVLAIVGVFAVISNPDFQRGFCNSYTNADPNQTCPFHPSSP